MAEMIGWYESGESSLTIGRRLGMHQSTVRRVLIEAGVVMRSRRDQIALQDGRRGVRTPTRTELAAGYVEQRLTSAELAVRFGISESRVHSLLRRHRIERRPGGIRPERAEAERARRRPPELIDRIIARYRSGASRAEVAADLGLHKATVDDVLRRAGVALRSGRKLPPVADWVDRYVIGGESGAEIAATFGVTANAVLRALEVAGIERRPARPRMAVLSDAAVVEFYVDEGLSLQATAQQLDVSVRRVREVVGRLGVLRSGFDPSGINRTKFARRHAEGATIAELAEEFNLTRHQVGTAVRSFDLPRRLPVTHRALPISDRQLGALIAAGHSDAEIASRHGVAVWAVTRRRRQAGLRRPTSNKVKPPIGRAQLERQLAGGRTRSEIATAYNVGLATVTRWCAHYGIDVAGSRPTSSRDGPVIDAKLLRHLYVDEEWTARQIGAEFGVDPSLVNFALHSHRIAVRHGGQGSPANAVVLLDALYADPEIVSVLERGGVPVRRRAGDLARRFPRPAPLDAGLVDDLYRRIGLSTTQIALLTGHSASNVLDVLRRHGIRARRASRSPWFVRTFL